MKRISLILASAAALAGISVHADETQNLVANGNAADGLTNWSGIQKTVEGGPDGANCFEVTGPTWIFSREHIAVDPNSEYQLAGWFKSGNDMPNEVYLGVLPFDENQLPIDALSVNVLENSETALTAQAAFGETLIKVNEASAWEPLLDNKQLVIAFDTDDSGEYRDLPNRKTYVVKSLEKKDGAWEVTLAKPLADEFSAGTKVRAHVKSEHFVYAFQIKKHFAEWTEYTGTIKPMGKSGAPRNAFWPGTKYVRILLLANWGQNHGETLQFGNISLKKVGPQK